MLQRSTQRSKPQDQLQNHDCGIDRPSKLVAIEARGEHFKVLRASLSTGLAGGRRVDWINELG